MNENPYIAPQAPLAASPSRKFRWESVAAAASIAFLTPIALVAVIALSRGVALPDFLLDPGFIGTLAVSSLVTASVLERANLWTWLYCIITSVATIVLLGGIVFMLRGLTR